VVAIVLAAGAAVLWGTSDFCGGKGSRRASPLAVAVGSQVASLPVLALALLMIPGEPRLPDLAWGAAAGVAGLTALVLLYRGLSAGAMTVVSPITAVTAAVVPLGAGLLLDGPLRMSALIGVAIAVMAIALVSVGHRGPHAPVRTPMVGLALGAGILFGTAIVLLGQVNPDSGLWALVGLRLGALLLGLPWAARMGTAMRLSRPALVWTVLAGSFDIVGSAFFLVAVGQGHLSIVAVLASLSPASTVLLALGVDRERLRAMQVVGLACAAAALALVAS
jgi:drug/metabolite transporter (DMT)-like permease